MRHQAKVRNGVQQFFRINPGTYRSRRNCTSEHPFAVPRPSNRQMNRTSVVPLLLGFALLMSGCNTVQQPSPPQTSNRDSRSAGEGAYNQTYRAESRHGHRHGRHDDGSNDAWTGYERAETADRSDNTDPDASPGTGGRPASRSRRHHNSAVTAAPGQFDFYVLNLSWSPEFCQSHATASECAQHRAFTLHGLWPQNTNGTYPEDCSSDPGPANPSQYADIYPDPSLLQHEWQTHGTCSGLAPDAFFALARRAEQSIHIPAELAQVNQQITLTPAQITTAFTQSNPSLPAAGLALTCGNNYLTAVEVCLDKNLKPESCSAVKTCGATQVRIPPQQ